MKKTTPVVTVAMCLLAVMASRPLAAQVAPATPPAEQARAVSERERRTREAEMKAEAERVNQDKPATGDKTVELSPFTVSTQKDSGYFAENTLAGSRLNTNLADLGASITVVTKQQMDDTASLDINDVFRYEANTEGSSTYSPGIVNRNTFKDSVGGYTDDAGNTTTNAQSNRLRGLGAPDASINYFPSNSRIPFDSYNTQSVEISRGPNSLLFGLGTPAGIVNQSAAQAVLNKNQNVVSLRTDQYGSVRSSFSINRSLVQDKLSLYLAFLYNDQQFERKPSSDLTRRQYAAITYKPFKKTTIRAFAENFLNDANRPNFTSPRDFVTPWLQAGRPVYDPITRMVTTLDTGRVVGPVVTNALSPGYVSTVNGVANPANTGAITTATNPWFTPGITFLSGARPELRLINGQVIDYFQRQPVLYVPAWTNPATTVPTAASLGWVAQDPRYAILDRQFASSTNLPAPTATIDGRTYTYSSWNFPGVTNANIYDWREQNILQANFSRLRAGNYNLEIEQEILPNLYFNAGWFRQDIDSYENNTLSMLTGATVTVDNNTRMINGQANPLFGLAYVPDGPGGTDTFYHPETDDNYRAMLAYDLDFTKSDRIWKWLGRHRLLGLWSEQDVILRSERWRLAFVDGDADGKLRYLPNPLLNNGFNLWNDQAFERFYYLAKPGDPQGKVTMGSGFWGNQGWQSTYSPSIEVYNYNTGQFQKDQMQVRNLFSNAGSYTSQREVVSTNFAVQSYLLEDRLITTLGWRHDKYRARRTTDGIISRVDGTVVAPALTALQIQPTSLNGLVDRDLIMNRYNRWDKLEGDTRTLGGAFRPLKNLNFVRRVAGDGVFGDLLNSLTFYYNESTNFNPPSTFQTDYFMRPLPKPTGSGRDGGFGFSILNDKLVARVNWFEVENQNERTTAAGNLLGRLAYGDTTLMIPWATAVVRLRNGANPAVANWNSDTVNPLTAAMTQQVYDLVKLPVNYYSGLSSGATQNSKAKGAEVQITYNPSRNWTMKLTGASQTTLYTGVAPQYDEWLAVRMPVWQAATATDIPDFVDQAGTAYSLRNFWTSYGYSSAARISNTDGNTDTSKYFNNTVVSQVATAKALEGAAASDQRKYRAAFLTNYVFMRGKLKGVSVGGSQRWESKASIGYYGKVGDPTAPTVINIADTTRPIYDHGNYYTDLWVSYSRRIFSDRIDWKIQLNANNVTEDGHLQPVAVNFDGSPWAFRIIDSRQFLLTSTFTF